MILFLNILNDSPSYYVKQNQQLTIYTPTEGIGVLSD